MDDTEQRIRERAHRLWEEEGRPDGREINHWEQARFLVRTETSPEASQWPHPEVGNHANGSTSPSAPEPIEPMEAIKNQSDSPDRSADQGEKSVARARRRSRGRPAKRA